MHTEYIEKRYIKVESLGSAASPQGEISKSIRLSVVSWSVGPKRRWSWRFGIGIGVGGSRKSSWWPVLIVAGWLAGGLSIQELKPQ